MTGTAAPRLTIVIPTRERCGYLPFAISSCLANASPNFEVLVLDNASVDDTSAAVAQFSDPRVRYIRNDARLSMRDNFERGVTEARGEVIGIIGDDDGLFPWAVDEVLAHFDRDGVEAVAGARAHYAWPDLLSTRNGTGILPRRSGFSVRRSRTALRRLLVHADYYRLPCAYHGFVARTAIDRAISRQGRFFIGSIPDAASTISLAMQDIVYVESERPFVVNGGSQRSNGAAQFGGGSDVERSNWRKEDDLGLIAGFDDALTVGPLIVESALRWCEVNGGSIDDVFDRADVVATLSREASMRAQAGRDLAESRAMFAATGIRPPDQRTRARGRGRASRLLRSFIASRPVDLERRGVGDVAAAAATMAALVHGGKVGLLDQPAEQLRIALRIARG